MGTEPNEKNTLRGRFVILMVTEKLNEMQMRKFDKNLQIFANENTEYVDKISLSEYKGGVL